MDIETDIYLNQLGQGVVDRVEGIKWFSQLSTSLQLEVLRRLVYFILQMGGTGNDAEAAIELSNLKKTYTPCRLLIKACEDPLGRKGLSASLAKIINLPANERLKSFELILALFSIVGKSNSAKVANPEKYWWHRNLAEQGVIDEIINDFTN